MTENKITTDSPDYQFSKNRINGSSLPRPSHSNHGSPWKLGLMWTKWARKVSWTVIGVTPSPWYLSLLYIPAVAVGWESIGNAAYYIYQPWWWCFVMPFLQSIKSLCMYAPTPFPSLSSSSIPSSCYQSPRSSPFLSLSFFGLNGNTFLTFCMDS